MHTVPAVSVILPTHNRAALLPRAMASVFGQTAGDLELIVVDDASGDDTSEVLDGAPDPRLRVITLDRNLGQAHARNVGIEAARAALLAFQDSDDVWYPHKLQTQLEAIAPFPDVSVVYSDMRRINGDGTSFVVEAPRELIPGAIFDARPSVYAPFGIGIQSCLARRDAIVEAGGFDVRRRKWDDLELFVRLLDRGHRFLHVPQTLVDYHESDGVTWNRTASRQARLDMLRVYGLRLARRSPRMLWKEVMRALSP
jgi:glycosyltransferase involved in cell wall biosynthesis